MTPIRQWLRLFVPVAAGVTIAAAATARLQYETDLQTLVERESRGLALADQRYAQQVLDAALDLRVMVQSPALRAYIDHPERGQRATLEQWFAAFIAQKPHFDAFTLFDDARNAVRVQRSGTEIRAVNPGAVPSEEIARGLQLARDLPLRGAHVSRLTLLEDGQGPRRPYQPALNLTLGIDTAGEDLALEARLRAAVLLRAIQNALQSPAATTWVLDHEGYWLVHPDPQMLWGQTLNPSLRLDTLMPRLAPILDTEEGTWRDEDGGLLIFRRLGTLDAAAPEAGLSVPGPLLAVQRVGPQALPPRITALPLALGLVVLLLWGAASWGLVRFRDRALHAERQTQALARTQRQVVDDQAWVRQHIYDLGLRINATPDLRSFGATFLSELAPSLNLAAACLYRLIDGRCVAVASFGMAHRDMAREFALGQGLVGEVARSRQERRLHPVPEGYLDLQGGLGSATVAEVRILPLHAQDLSFGVMELACTQRLDARQEELLRQLIPVLALNLAGRSG